ncbi:hypothetical protein, partial [Streptomyces sp.]|uniref:WXG100-like domain-containing protein n=1 Tax=Streptomyces sp. TaxID=1931 RepID=UPI002F3FCB47
MSINPPQQIADFFGFLTGMPWPEADEDLMRTVANDYYAVAEDLTILEGYIGQLVPIVLEHFEGDAAESYAAAMRDLIGEVSGPNTMHQTSQLSHDLGDAARNVANQVEYTKLMAIIQVVELLVQVLAAMFFSPFTFGGSFFNVALEFAFTREALKNLFIWLLRTIASQTFMGIAGGLFQDMIIQVYQLSSHHTDKWNTDSTIESLKQGALGGLLAGPLELFGQGAGKLLGKIFGKGAGSILSKKIESSLKAGMNGLENSAEHFAENVGKTVGHAALDGFNGFVGTEIKSLGKKTVGELAGAAAESGARGAAKSAAEGAEQAAERDIAKLAGKLGDEASQQAFAKDVGNLLGAAVPQIEAGFVRFGSGTIAEAFAERMGTVFEKHLADAADPVLRGEANKIGRDFGEAFARNWGRLGADHSGLNDALSRALGGLAEHRGLSALAHGLPELFTPGQITGNAVSKLFQRMFEEHPLHGNTLYQLGHSVGEMLKDGMENNFNEGTYNLIFMEDHQFTTSWNTFVSGAAMGLIGKTLHKLFEPAMTRYQEWLRDRQFRDNPDDSAYFGLLHPLNFVSFIANMSGHSAPFPVPRPTSYDVDASAGESAKDLLRWFFGNPFSGFDFRADAPVVNWFTSSDTPVPGDRPTQDAVAETLGGIRTSGGADPGVTGVTGDGTAPGHDEDTSDGAPATADAAATPPSRPRTETAGGPDGARAPVEPHTPAAGTGGDTADAFDAGLPRLTESRPFRDEFAHRDDFDLVEPSTRPAHAPVSGPRTEAVGPYTPADPATGHVGHQDTATVSDAFDAVPAGHQESPPTEPTTRLTAQAPDRTTLTPGRTRGHDADAHEPTPAVDRVHGLGLLDDQPDAAGSYPRPAPLAEPVDRVTARDGTSVRDDEVRTRPIADPVTGENIGRGVLDDTEWSAVGPSLSGLPRTLHYETGLEWNENTLVRDVPWDAEHTYFYVGHGNDEGFHLETEHGEKRASGEQLGGFLRRRPSVIRLKQAADEGKPASITLIACESAAHAQAVADATGLPVHAPTAGIDFGEDGLFAAATESGAAGEIRTFRPGGPGPVADGKPNEPTMRPVVVPFGPASTTLDLRWAEHLADVARNIAPELVRRHRAGLPAPVIRVTGRGGGPAGAEDGKARADAVANVLTAALRGYLVPRGVDFDTLSLVRTASERASEPPAGDRPDRQADQGPWTATVSLEYPRPGARPSRVPVTGIPAGGWIGEHQLPAPSARRFREALEHLPPRDDAYVLAMHVGENGAPITAEQLADTLIDAYDCGKLDGKATVDFVACGLGALVHDHVPEAMAALWAHHALHGRPGVPAVIQGRAPVGPVWAVPKVVDGSVRPDGERALVVADYVGVRPDGTPVVVSGPDAFWRTFRDSGDGAHTPETSVGGGRLASDGSTDHELPTGYERHDAAKVNEPSAGLTPIEGAVTFGAEGNGGPSQQNRVPSGTGTGPASRNRPPGGTDHPPRGPRGSGSDPATAPDRRDRRASPAEPREQPSERSVRRDRLGVPSTDRSRSASPAPERRDAGAGRAFAAQPGRSERSRERSPFSRSQ